MCDNRGGFLSFINHGATELFQHLEGALRDSKAAFRFSKREIKTLPQARLQSFRTGLGVHRQIYRDKCHKYIALISQCKTQYCKSKIESADRCQPFGLLDGMFRAKPVPLLAKQLKSPPQNHTALIRFQLGLRSLA